METKGRFKKKKKETEKGKKRWIEFRYAGRARESAQLLASTRRRPNYLKRALIYTYSLPAFTLLVSAPKMKQQWHTHTHTCNSDHWTNQWDENDHVAFAATSVRVPPPQDSFPYVLLRNELLRDSRDNAQFERTVVTDSPLMRFLLPRKRNEKERQNQQNITKVENNATRTDKILRNEIRERECDCAGSAFRMIMQNGRRKKKETAIRLGAPQLAYFFFIAHTHTRTQKCLAASFLLAELFISFSLPTAQLPLPPKKKKKKYELCASRASS